jgi:ABC-type polysaccharide/polyol phosphate transport system ATPase subunit
METIREVTQTVLWLDHGTAAMLGEPDEVVDAYLASQREGTDRPVGVELVRES